MYHDIKFSTRRYRNACVDQRSKAIDITPSGRAQSRNQHLAHPKLPSYLSALGSLPTYTGRPVAGLQRCAAMMLSMPARNMLEPHRPARLDVFSHFSEHIM
jgi:hypothetical protein